MEEIEYYTGIHATVSRLHKVSDEVIEIVLGGSYLLCAEGWITETGVPSYMVRSVQGCNTITIPDEIINEVEVVEGEEGEEEDGASVKFYVTSTVTALTAISLLSL